jgi:hypothetical protein
VVTRNVEIAWAAGLFEGEGCVTEINRRFALAVKNTDEEVIRFDEIVGLGRMYGPLGTPKPTGIAGSPSGSGRATPST